MAQSRLEKVGTIYTRTVSLLEAGAMKEENRPFWLKIYKAFPPKYEPSYDRPGSKASLRPILYKEDKIRARFHKDYKHFSMVNLADNRSVSKTEQFLIIYRQLEEQNIPEAELYDKAVEEFSSKIQLEKTQREEFAAAQSEPARRRRMRGANVSHDLKEDEKVASELSPEERQKYKPIRLSLEKLVQEMKEENDSKEKKPK